MTPDTFYKLRVGDVVRPAGGERAFVVTGNYGGRVTAVATVDMTNPAEWELVMRTRHVASPAKGGEA